MNKKILLATGIYPPAIGGPATYSKTLREELPKNGLEVKVLTYGKTEDRDDEAGVYRISRKQNILMRYFKYFFAAMKLASWADLVYAQDPVSAGLPICVACFLKRKKFILKIVGDHAWEQGRQRFGVEDNLDEFQEKKYIFKVEILRVTQIAVAKNAKLIITPSRYLKNIVNKWGINEDKIKVIYNAVKKAEQSLIKKTELRKKLNLEGFTILSAGRLVPWKGFQGLIGLMPELIKISPDFKLVIAGEGPDKNELRAEVNRLDLKNNIMLTGSLPQKTLWDYMSAADIFVLNTDYEGLPHITIEAMQLNLPVITTKSGGNPEVVEEGVSGLLINYNKKEEIIDAILKLYRDPEYADKLAAQAKEEVKSKFSKELMIEKVVKVLKSI